MKKPETPIRGNNLLQARPLRRSVRGSPAARRDSRRRPLGGAAATSMAVDPGRWMVVQRWGRLPCGEPHRARAPRPSAPRQRLSAAPVSSMAARRVGSGEWGVGSGARQGAGAAAGGRALSPEARGGQPLTPSLRKIAPRGAAQPLRHQEGGGVGAGPHEIERRRRKLAKNGKKATRIFGVFGVFFAVFFPPTPLRNHTALRRLTRGAKG